MVKKMQLSLFLAASLAALSLTGCNTSATPSASQSAGTSQEASSQAEPNDSADTVNLVVTWWGNQVRNERTQQVFELFSEENPGVTIDGQFSEFSDYWTKMATAAAGHTMPDVLQMVPDNLEGYAKNELIADLTPYIESGALDVSSVDANTVDLGKTNDGIYAIALGLNTGCMLYNKTLLDEYGFTINDNMTTDDFMDLSRQIYEKTGYKVDLITGDVFKYMQRATGKSLFGDDRLGVDSPEDFADYFMLCETALAEGWALDARVYAERAEGNLEQNAMIYGTAPENMTWCTYVATNQIQAIQNAAPEGVEISMTTWPSSNPEKSKQLNAGVFFSLSAESTNPDEAVKLINYFTNSVEANEILLAERGAPISSAVADSIIPKLDDSGVKSIDYINNVIKPGYSPSDPPAPEGAAEFNNLFSQIREQLFYGEINAQEACQQLFDQGNSIIAAAAQK